jgi:hypothetical protein
MVGVPRVRGIFFRDCFFPSGLITHLYSDSNNIMSKSELGCCIQKYKHGRAKQNSAKDAMLSIPARCACERLGDSTRLVGCKMRQTRDQLDGRPSAKLIQRGFRSRCALRGLDAWLACISARCISLPLLQELVFLPRANVVPTGAVNPIICESNKVGSMRRLKQLDAGSLYA